MLKIKPGDLVKNITIKRKEKRTGVILSNYFKEADWFCVLCNGKKERWHISNIVLV
tara:strand:- start:1795 stop:1962 length:168 start_codon:yes stop_codon:yes gene_type:complete